MINRHAIDDPRLAWFPQARFGMFIHFGLYALLGRGEWVQYREQIPRGEYEKLGQRFHPAKFDARAWVALARQSGCRYIVFTAKHHDGFCLFDSDLTDFKITNTPFGRDLTGELIAACRRVGMRVVLYYSQPDWHHRHFVHQPGAQKDLDHPPPDQEPDWERYLAYYHGQVRELCTNYGRIDGIWFDGVHKSAAAWQGRKIYRMIKKLQPGAVVNERSGYGDFYTPERTIPEDLRGYLFEACQSVAQLHWGYKADSPQYSVPTLLRSLTTVASKGGNFLLNVGPDAHGVIPARQRERMLAVGEWLRKHGGAIYGTTAGDFDTGSPDVVATRKAKEVHLLLKAWPDTDRLVIPGIRSRPISAVLSGNAQRLQTSLTPGGLQVEGLPSRPAEDLVYVIRLRFARVPNLKILPRYRAPSAVGTAIDPDHATCVPVAAASPRGMSVKGARARVVRRAQGPFSYDLRGPEHTLIWHLDIPRSGIYRCRVQMACPTPYHGSTYALRNGSHTLHGRVPATKSFDDFQWSPAGEMPLHSGRNRIVLQPRQRTYEYVFAQISALQVTPMNG